MIPPIKHLRLAALFHDIGKPSTFTLGDDGVGHFYTHPSVSRDMADQILLRLKYDNKTRETVVKLVKWHDHVIEPTESAVKKMLSKTTKELFFNLILLKRADNLGQNPDYHTRQSTYDEIVALASDILARQECLSLKTLSVKGGDLIALGIPIGKRIGVILERLLSEVLNGNLPNEKEELILFVKNNLME
ncbi:MAG: HD domain-containing protein [Clostridia bacterium]|nr:HD domain-containing protein [Clostridia bacterium]